MCILENIKNVTTSQFGQPCFPPFAIIFAALVTRTNQYRRADRFKLIFKILIVQ